MLVLVNIISPERMQIVTNTNTKKLSVKTLLESSIIPQPLKRKSVLGLVESSSGDYLYFTVRIA